MGINDMPAGQGDVLQSNTLGAPTSHGEVLVTGTHPVTRDEVQCIVDQAVFVLYVGRQDVLDICHAIDMEQSRFLDYAKFSNGQARQDHQATADKMKDFSAHLRLSDAVLFVRTTPKGGA